MICEGLRIGFEANPAELLARLSSVFAPGSIPTDFAKLDFAYSLSLEPQGHSYAAYFGSVALVKTTSLEIALSSIATSVQHTVAKHSRRHLFLHAGVIGWRGKAVLFPGRTFTGKSTLVRALIRAGAVYFSDEFARIDASGLVHPFPRPLSLRCREGRILVRPEDEGIEIASGPSTVGAIVIARYKTDALWDPCRLSRGHAMLELLSNSVAVRSDPAKAMRLMRTLASTGVAIRSFRGDAEATAPVVLKTLDDLMN